MTITDVLKGDLCTGCGLCVSVLGHDKIRMSLDAKGFYRPTLDSPLSDNPNSISDFCPGITLCHTESSSYHPHWGSIDNIFFGSAVDEQVSFLGSSGGVVSALAIYLLESGVVDGVIHTKASDIDPLGNMTTVSRNREEVLKGAGSRYAPSAPLQDILKIAAEQGVFAFIGKPCDVAALRSHAKQNRSIREKIKYTISFFCAGIPSRSGTEEILGTFGLVETDVAEIRYRGMGWPGKTTVTSKKGEIYTQSYSDSWGNILNRWLQFRCKICPDGSGEFADISCGDGWYGGENGYPSFDEEQGRSLILTRTQKGSDLLSQAIESGYIKTDSCGIDELRFIQPYQYKRKSLVLARVLALKLAGRFTPSYKGLKLTKAAMAFGILYQVRNFLGMLKRVWKGDL